MKTLLNFITENWEIISGIGIGIIEILLRRWPTSKNISIIDNAWKLLNWIIVNRRKSSGGEFKSKDKENFISVKTNKHVLFMLLFVSSVGFSQSPVTTQSRGLFLYNGSDTTFLKNTRTSLQNATGNTGGLFFDKTNNKWRVWDGSTWVNWNLFNNSGVGNFWPLVGEGLFTGNVSISGGPGYNLDFFNHGNVTFEGINTGQFTVENFTDIQLNATSAINLNSQNSVSVSSLGGMNISSDNGITIQNPPTSTSFLMNENITFNTPEGIITSNGKHFFTPTATRAGLNIGTFASLPSTFVTGDLFYHTGQNTIAFRSNTADVGIIGTQGVAPLTINGIPIASSAYGVITNANLTFTGGNTLNTVNEVISANLTLSAIPSTRALFTTTAGLITSDIDYTYNAAADILSVGTIDVGNGGISQNSAFTLTIGGNNGLNTVIIPGISTESVDIGSPIPGIVTGNINLNNTGAGDIVISTEDQLILIGNTTLNGVPLIALSGTYTPVTSALTNVTSATPAQWQYTRVGNVVNLSGQISIDPITTGMQGGFLLTLPVVSDFTSQSNAGGVGSMQVVTPGANAEIGANTTSDQLAVTIWVTDVSLQTYRFTAQYLVQ